MREITLHKTNECNEAITITADERDEKYGNSSHYYKIEYASGPPTEEINFQRGPLKEVGVNGLTNEALLAILIDRMEGFQGGPFACDHNREALTCLLNAMRWLQERTKERLERGVEGTNIV